MTRPRALARRGATTLAAVLLALIATSSTGIAAAWGQPAASNPSQASQPTSTPQASASPGDTTAPPELTLDPTAGRPGAAVLVSRSGWKGPTCQLDYAGAPAVGSDCTVTNDVLSGSLAVPTTAAPGTTVPVEACPTACADVGDGFTATAPLLILAAPALTSTSGPVSGQAHHGRHHPRHTAAATPTLTLASSGAGHTGALIGSIAAILLAAAVIALWLFRRTPPGRTTAPTVSLTTRPDPGVERVEPAAAAVRVTATIRLRPDAGDCRLEAMPR